MRFYIDRITPKAAVCDDDSGLQYRFPIEILPNNIREGGVLLLQNGVFSMDTGTEAERRKALFNRQQALFLNHGDG